MPISENPESAAPASAGGRKLDLVAKLLGGIGAVFCGMLILAGV